MREMKLSCVLGKRGLMHLRKGVAQNKLVMSAQVNQGRHVLFVRSFRLKEVSPKRKSSHDVMCRV